MRIVAISGANRGLGLEFCRQLMARGDRVIAGSRTPSRAGELTRLAVAHPGRLTILPLDVLKPNGVAEFARELAMIVDRVDVLINNAGVLPSGETYGQVAVKNLLEAFATNCAGSLLLTQALTPMLESSAKARVMSISSELGSIAKRDAFRNPSYSISKAALNMAVRLAAFELLPRGIIAFAVHPGWVRTDMGGAGADIDAAESIAGMRRALAALQPSQTGSFLDYDGTPLAW